MINDKVLDSDLLLLRERFKKLHPSSMPECPFCYKPFVNPFDVVTGLPNIYLWQPSCGCFHNEKFVLSLG